jgi:hypothetical protein
MSKKQEVAIMRGLRIVLSIALLGVVSIALLGLAGCASLGPATIRRDRVDFAEAIIDAAKRETLLNIVKLRYADTPGLVSVNQLVAGYSLNTSATVGTAFQQQTFNFANDVNLGVSGSFSENPTVTYTPVAGEDFARVMLTPIPPSELFAMVAAGAPPDIMLGLGVQSINGLRNWSANARGATPADPGFSEVLGLLDALRRDGEVGFGFATKGGVQTADLLINAGPKAPLESRVRRLIELLGLDPAGRSFHIAFGFGDGARQEIKVYTRSLFDILSSLAARIQVPDADIAAGRTYQTRLAPVGLIPQLAVKHQVLSPESTFAAVEYQGTWYWVDDTDYASKRVFTGLMLILNVVEKTGQPQLPVITIPTG